MKSNFIGLVLILGLIAYGFWKNYEAEQFMISEGRKLGLECFLVNSSLLDTKSDFLNDVEARKADDFYIWNYREKKFIKKEFNSDNYTLKECARNYTRSF